MNRKTEGVQRIWERYKWAVLVILAGVVALLWPSGGTKETSTAQSTAVAALGDPEALQEEMEEILSHISGVGQVRLLLTVETDGERQLAGNTETSYSGSASAPEDFSRSWEAVMAIFLKEPNISVNCRRMNRIFSSSTIRMMSSAVYFPTLTTPFQNTCPHYRIPP